MNYLHHDSESAFMPEDSHTNRVIMNPVTEKQRGGTIDSKS